jgi:hypothetical protein
MHINQLKESNYLKKEDCDPPILVTIDHLTQKNVALEGDPPDMKYCLHFAEDIKPMILNSTNAQLIARALNSEETDEWKGKQVVLYNDPNVSFQGKLVGGIRVRPAKKNKVTGQTAPATEQDDEIPF